MHIKTTALCLFKSNCMLCTNIRLLPLEQFCMLFKKIQISEVQNSGSPVEGSIFVLLPKGKNVILFLMQTQSVLT